MRKTIEVSSRDEGKAIARALDDPEFRAYAVTMGVLAGLPDDAARARVLHCAEILLSSAPDSRPRGNGRPREYEPRLAFDESPAAGSSGE
jgi:hypothetical protein